MKALSSVFVLLLASVFLTACLPGLSAPEETTPAVMEESTGDSMEKGTTLEDDSAAKMEGDQAAMEKSVVPEDGRVAMAASNFKYDVTEIRAKAGEPLTIAVTNDEGFHDLVIDELEVNSGMIPAGETMELEIPTDKPGTYEFYCSVGEHRAMGMKGMLIIE